MSDTVDRRTPPPPSVASTATAFGAAGLIISTVDYLWKHKTGTPWPLPDDALIIMWVTSLAPSCHLVGRIINNHLKKLAGDE